MNPLAFAWHWYCARSAWAAWAFAATAGLATSVFPWRPATSPLLIVPWLVVAALVVVVRYLSYKATAEAITGPLNALPESETLALLVMLADPDVPPEWKPALSAAEPYLENLAHLHADVRQIVTRESDKLRDKRSRRVYGTVRGSGREHESG